MLDRTRAVRRSALALAAVATLAGPLGAQNHRVAFGPVGGFSVHGELAPGLASSAKPEAGPYFGLQAEVWPGRARFGIRLNGAFAERTLDSGAGRYGMLMGDANVLFRVLPVKSERRVAPFLALGGGMTRYSSVGISPPLGGGAYGADPVTRPHALVAAGADVMLHPMAGLRFEIGDQMVFPSVGESPEAQGLPVAHNLRISGGVQLLLLDRQPRPATVVARGEIPEGTSGAAAALLRQRNAEVERLQARVDSLERELAARPAGEGAGRVAAAEPATREPARQPARAARRPARAAGQPAGAAATARTPGAPSGQAAAPQSAEARFTVQVGSFVEPATADRWAERLRQRGLPVWRIDLALQGQRVSRIRVGALPTKAEAERLASVLTREFRWQARADEIEDADRPPANAVRATRAYLAGG
jgi:cell division septation protein DedD